MQKIRHFFQVIILTVVITSCSGLTDTIPLSIDKELGKQLSSQIKNSSEYMVLDSSEHKQVYDYVQEIRNNILQSEKINYEEEFAYKITVLKNDDELNAFATPGGHIYIYTGLIKYLDTEAQLAGVMAHEIAHAEERHAVEQLAGRIGIGLLTSIIFEGNYADLISLGENLLALNFSRSDESEADTRAVEYLYDTPYDPRGVAGFFQKLSQDNTTEVPAFLSTHPSSKDRVEEILKKWEEMGKQEGKIGREKHSKVVETLN